MRLLAGHVATTLGQEVETILNLGEILSQQQTIRYHGPFGPVIVTSGDRYHGPFGPVNGGS